MSLQIAFKAINDTIGLDSLVPTLLVFGAYPYIAELDAPLLTVIQRTSAIKKAIDEINKIRAKRQIVDALNIHNGPRTNPVYNLLPNLLVLV